jgi:hypothetical protein
MAYTAASAKRLLGGKRLPWFMIDIDNNQLITSPTIPTSIRDSKPIVFAEQQVPGLNYTPMNPNRNGNGTLSFELPIIDRRGTLGNSNLLSQFELLRNQVISFRNLLSRGSQFAKNPEVIYYWGTHRPPLNYIVTQCDMEHRSDLTNPIGASQFTMVQMTLQLNENSKLYRAWQVSRRLSAIAGNVTGIRQASSKGSRPY